MININPVNETRLKAGWLRADLNHAKHSLWLSDIANQLLRLAHETLNAETLADLHALQLTAHHILKDEPK